MACAIVEQGRGQVVDPTGECRDDVCGSPAVSPASGRMSRTRSSFRPTATPRSRRSSPARHDASSYAGSPSVARDSASYPQRTLARWSSASMYSTSPVGEPRPLPDEWMRQEAQHFASLHPSSFEREEAGHSLRRPAGCDAAGGRRCDRGCAAPHHRSPRRRRRPSAPTRRHRGRGGGGRADEASDRRRAPRGTRRGRSRAVAARRAHR